jgi:hypothetical protein
MKEIDFYIDDIANGCPVRKHRRPSLDSNITDKDATIQTFLHYSDHTANQERTVFGRKRPGLFYNYDDRLYGEKWNEGCDLAVAAGIKPKTARFYEAVLNHFHDTDTVSLQHVILGCNRSNGYSYLVFGYTYGAKS